MINIQKRSLLAVVSEYLTLQSDPRMNDSNPKLKIVTTSVEQSTTNKIVIIIDFNLQQI
jgi:hypothetical protein